MDTEMTSWGSLHQTSKIVRLRLGCVTLNPGIKSTQMCPTLCRRSFNLPIKVPCNVHVCKGLQVLVRGHKKAHCKHQASTLWVSRVRINPTTSLWALRFCDVTACV